MTLYRFTSRAFQRTSTDLDEECVLLIKVLGTNPVLQRATIACTPQPPTLDIEAYVSADGSNKMAVIMAIAAAEDEWKSALKHLGLHNRTVNTQLSPA